MTIMNFGIYINLILENSFFVMLNGTNKMRIASKLNACYDSFNGLTLK